MLVNADSQYRPVTIKYTITPTNVILDMQDIASKVIFILLSSLLQSSTSAVITLLIFPVSTCL